MSELVVPYAHTEPAVPPYSRSIRVWGISFAVAGFLLDQAFVNLPAKALLEDFLALGLICLVTIVAIRTLVLWREQKAKKELERTLLIRASLPSFPHVGIAVASLLFLGLWFSRWRFGWDFALHPEETLRYRTFLQSGHLLALTTFVMASQRVRSWWEVMDLTPGRMVLITYAIASLIGTFLLILPFSLRPDASLALIDAFFISVSAITVTGLSPVNIFEVFSLFGQGVLLFFIQLGGLGLVVLSVGLAVVSRRRLSLAESMMGRELYDVPDVGRMKTFLGRVVFYTVVLELAGALLIWPMLPGEMENRFFQALFHSVSAFCNAGFSIFPETLEIPGLTLMKSILSVLIILGGIGFPVMFEVMDRARGRIIRKRYSPNTLLCLTSAGILLLGGAAAILSTEIAAGLHEEGILARLGHSLFYSISARTAGFNITPMDHLTQGSQLIILILMIIGGSPLSTAGGIKTTTASIFLISTSSLLRGLKWIQYRSSEIPYFLLQKCVSVVVLYLMASITAIVLLLALEDLDPWTLTFEAVSALSTVGLSLGATAQLGIISKFVLIALMFVGRLGVVTAVYVGVGSVSGQRFRYPQEQFYVG